MTDPATPPSHAPLPWTVARDSIGATNMIVALDGILAATACDAVTANVICTAANSHAALLQALRRVLDTIAPDPRRQDLAYVKGTE